MKQKKSISIPSKKEAKNREVKKNLPPSWISNRVTLIFLILLAGVVWFGFYATHTKGIVGSDDREYASIARNIVNGKGIVRNFIYPVDINFFEKVPIPEFMHPPGYPLIIAGFFKVFGVSEFAALLPSYLSYFLLVVLFFFFARKYLDLRTAVIACAVLVFNKEILNASLVALSEEVYALAFFLFFIVFVQARSLKNLFVAGVLLGISHLIRENLYPFLIPLLVHLYFYPNLPRFKKMIFFIMGMVVTMIPNTVRAFIETGSPFFSYGKFVLMSFTEKYPWLSVYRDIQNLSLFEFILGEPSQFLLKYLNNLVMAVEQILSVSNPYLLLFFLVEIFNWKVSHSFKQIKVLFLFLFIFQILFVSLFTFNHRYFIHFLPLMTIFAAQSFLRLSDEFLSSIGGEWKKRFQYLPIFLFVIFFMLPSIYVIFMPYRAPELNFKNPQFGFLIPKHEAKKLNDFLKEELGEKQVVWTDLPEILEWEGDRLCGWVPLRLEYIYQIHKKIPVDAIFLTNLRTSNKLEGEWQYLFFSNDSLPRYRTVKFYKSKTIFAKLLIRDEKD